MVKTKREHKRKAAASKSEKKEELFNQIQACVDEYPFIYVFKVQNMRNKYLKSVRSEWNGSRIFMGKNHIIARALGKTEGDEIKKNIHLISKKLIGNVGLLFTNVPEAQALEYFNEKKEQDYARTGSIATETIIIPSGEVMRAGEPFPHSLETQIRGLGVPTLLKNGIVTLSNDFTVCKEGQVLSSEQARLLKMFYIPMSETKVDLIGVYDKTTYKELE